MRTTVIGFPAETASMVTLSGSSGVRRIKSIGTLRLIQGKKHFPAVHPVTITGKGKPEKRDYAGGVPLGGVPLGGVPLGAPVWFPAGPVGIFPCGAVVLPAGAAGGAAVALPAGAAG